MKCYTLQVGDKTYDLRLDLDDMIKLEKVKNKPIVQIMTSQSVTDLVNTLMYLRRGGSETEKNFDDKDAKQFFNELVDNEFAIEDILSKVILPTLQVSGLLKKSDLEKAKVQMEVLKEQATL